MLVSEGLAHWYVHGKRPMAKWQRYPKSWVDPDTLYPRQEIAQRTGLKEDVLSFWIKRGLLEHAEGGEGKGSHRRFHYSQINIAVILAVFRENFGANIATLSSLASLLQSAVKTFKNSTLSFGDWSQAAYLGNLLDRFRRGEPVMVDAHDLRSEDYRKLPPEERYRKRPAKTEAEIIADIHWLGEDPSGVVRAAEALGPGHETEALIALVVLGLVLDPSYMSDIYWLMMQADDGWVVGDGSDESTSDLSDLGPALFLPVVPLLKRTWGIPSSPVLMREREAERLQELLEGAGIHARVVVNERDGFMIDADDADWPLVERVLGTAKYQVRRKDVEADQ